MIRPVAASFLTISLLTSTAFAQNVTQEQINDAVDRGVKSIRTIFEGQDEVNLNHFREPRHGVVSLLGWTLLESGAPATDPDIKKIARVLRKNPDASQNYSLSLAIIFLDRLGNPADSLLIQAYAVRLLEGQLQFGGWSYDCGDIPAGEVEALKAYYELIEKDPSSTKARDIKMALQRQLSARAALAARRPINTFRPGFGADNSNSQFAAIALWVARRHQVPVDRALQIVSLFARSTQGSNGSWWYGTDVSQRAAEKPTLGMTCAGLICIALGRATMGDADMAKALAADPAVLNGFAAVARFMKTPPSADDKNAYYSLWSMERVGMIYNLEKIAGVDWYQWAANFLVTTQSFTGAWAGEYERDFYANTCFALLILKKANPASDLATKLKAPKGKVNLFAPIEKGKPEKSSRLHGSPAKFWATIEGPSDSPASRSVVAWPQVGLVSRSRVAVDHGAGSFFKRSWSSSARVGLSLAAARAC